MNDNTFSWYGITAVQAFLGAAIVGRLAQDIGSMVLGFVLLKVTYLSIGAIGFIALSLWATNQIANRFIVAEIDRIIDRVEINKLKIFDLPRLVLICATPAAALMGFILAILL